MRHELDVFLSDHYIAVAVRDDSVYVRMDRWRTETAMKDDIVVFYKGTGVSQWRNPTGEQVRAMQKNGWILREDWIKSGRKVYWPDE